MAVRLCPWMDRLIFAPAISALPPSVVVVFRKEPGMAMRLCPSMDILHFPHFPHLTAMDGGNAIGL